MSLEIYAQDYAGLKEIISTRGDVSNEYVNLLRIENVDNPIRLAKEIGEITVEKYLSKFLELHMELPFEYCDTGCSVTYYNVCLSKDGHITYDDLVIVNVETNKKHEINIDWEGFKYCAKIVVEEIKKGHAETVSGDVFVKELKFDNLILVSNSSNYLSAAVAEQLCLQLNSLLL